MLKRLSNQISTVAMISGALIGSSLNFVVGYNIYAPAAALAVAAAVPIIFYFPKDASAKTEKRTSFLSYVREGIEEIRKDKRLISLIALAAISQIFLQTYFNLWQGYILEVGVKSKDLFWSHLVFKIIGIIAYYTNMNQCLNRFIFFSGFR